MTPAMLGAGAAALSAFGLLIAWLMRAIGREQRVGERLLAVQRSAGIDQVALPWSPRRVVLRGLAATGRLLTGGGILSRRTVDELEQTLMAAGFRGDRALAIFVGAKMLLLVGLPLVAAAALRYLGAGQKAWAIGMLVAAIGGLLAPDLFAKRLRRRYLRELERGLPMRSTSWSSAPRPGSRWKARWSGWRSRSARPTALSPPNSRSAAASCGSWPTAARR